MSASDIFTFILEQLVSFFLGYIPSLVLSLSPVQIAWVVGGSLVALYVLWIGFVHASSPGQAKVRSHALTEGSGGTLAGRRLDTGRGDQLDYRHWHLRR